MARLIIIVQNTIKEGLRKKFLPGLLFFCFVILVFSLFLGQLSINEKKRITIDFGLAGIQITLSALSVLLGSVFISGDLEQRTIWAVLSRPVRPSVFFLGRFLGITSLIFLALCALSLTLTSFFFYLDVSISLTLFQALFGFFLESILLLAFVLFFFNFITAFLVPFYCLGIFVIGHWLDSLLYLTKKGTGVFVGIFPYIINIFPNLEYGNWKTAVVYGDTISGGDFSMAVLYFLLWIGCILSLSLFLFERKDFL
ncbi:MAG: hypothetical protein OXB86_06890 [Bdellovibrionales bacterium]|nr:hypothetical protein [Bdellovibrionales bacterium]